MDKLTELENEYISGKRGIHDLIELYLSMDTESAIASIKRIKVVGMRKLTIDFFKNTSSRELLDRKDLWLNFSNEKLNEGYKWVR